MKAFLGDFLGLNFQTYFCKKIYKLILRILIYYWVWEFLSWWLNYSKTKVYLAEKMGHFDTNIQNERSKWTFLEKTTVRLNDCFLGKISLAKNLQMVLMGVGGWQPYYKTCVPHVKRLEKVRKKKSVDFPEFF